MERGHPQKRVAGLRLFSGSPNFVSDLCPGRSCALRALLGPNQHGRRRFARRVPFGRWEDLAMPGLRQQLPTTVSLEDSGRTVTVPPLPPNQQTAPAGNPAGAVLENRALPGAVMPTSSGSFYSFLRLTVNTIATTAPATRTSAPTGIRIYPQIGIWNATPGMHRMMVPPCAVFTLT